MPIPDFTLSLHMDLGRFSVFTSRGMVYIKQVDENENIIGSCLSPDQVRVLAKVLATAIGSED